MEQLTKVFAYGTTEVRTVMIEGQPWFVAKDICEVLEVANPTDALKRLDDDERARFNLGRQGEANVVNETGLYSLILGSRKTEARSFKRWITHDVIPSIRQNGMYATDTLLDNPDFLIETVTRLRDERNARIAAETQLSVQAPKVAAYDTFIDTEGTQSMAEVSKALGIGRNKLYARLRDEDMLTQENLPYQRYIDGGYFEVVESVKRIVGRLTAIPVTRVTPKGIAYLQRRLSA
ncbi:prophage antirepressor-like protein [Paenibacillus sp. DS2015]|uniref:BRO family protein n=1 Tax=Paenibacillus sp. DS2015 TaxID=3373917 RepID=UPI003D1CC8A0